MKYIIFDWDGIPTPFLFPNHIQHGSVAMMINAKPTSAGFVEFGDVNTIHCYGESVSLKLKNNEGDAKIIRKVAP